MPASSIPAVLKRLAELHAVYAASGASWWRRWDAKRRTLQYLTRYGAAIVEHIDTQEREILKHPNAVSDARREGFYSGRMAQEKYDRLLAHWKKARKGKEPKPPKPN